jgi:hypothetical protein
VPAPDTTSLGYHQTSAGIFLGGANLCKQNFANFPNKIPLATQYLRTGLLARYKPPFPGHNRRRQRRRVAALVSFRRFCGHCHIATFFNLTAAPQVW